MKAAAMRTAKAKPTILAHVFVGLDLRVRMDSATTLTPLSDDFASEQGEPTMVLEVMSAEFARNLSV
jgi:hypothetical protein